MSLCTSSQVRNESRMIPAHDISCHGLGICIGVIATDLFPKKK